MTTFFWCTGHLYVSRVYRLSTWSPELWLKAFIKSTDFSKSPQNTMMIADIRRGSWHCDSEYLCTCCCKCTHIAVGTARPACAGWWGCRLPAGSGCLAASLSAVWSQRGPWWRRYWQRETPALWDCWSGSLSHHLLSYSPEKYKQKLYHQN